MDEAQLGPHPGTPAPINLQESLQSHGDRLLRSAYLLCGNRTEAQDLVQETYLQAMRSIGRFRGKSAVYTWLYGILLNLSRRHARKQGRLVFEEERVLEAAFQAPPAAELDRSTTSARLEMALLQLSPAHREVIVLRYYEGMKIGAIASCLGTSTGTVKSRLHYAIRGLTESIPGEMNLFTAEGTHIKEPL
ncbi:MAG TPA: RNA polymerase sigma factor [Opitutaceae bacterium]|jgi:RNA polymerase sigma-70 factor (ECF subfamily)